MSRIVVKIPTIAGQSTEAGFVAQIQCTAMRHAMSIPVSNTQSTRTGGIATHGSIEMTHRIDKATPGLKLAATKGTGLNTVAITRLKTVAGKPAPVEKWTLSNAYVTRVELDTPVDHATNEPGEPVERFHLAYAGIQWDFLEDAANTTGSYNTESGETASV